MPIALTETVEALESCGLSRDQAVHAIRTAFGHHRRKAIERLLFEDSLERKANTAKRNRQTAVERLWRRIELDMQGKRAYALRQQAESIADFRPYYEAAVQVLDKALGFLRTHWAKAAAHPKGLPTPAAYAAQARLEGGKGLATPNPSRKNGHSCPPPGGDVWLDWIPPHVLEMMDDLAQACQPADAHSKARPPRLFRPKRSEANDKRLQAMALSIDATIEQCEVKLEALGFSRPQRRPDGTFNAPNAADSGNRFPEFRSLDQKRTALAIWAELFLEMRCKTAFDRLKLTDKLPIEHAHLVGTKLSSVMRRVTDLPDESLARTDTADLASLANTLVTQTIDTAVKAKQARLDAQAKRKPRKRLARAITGSDKSVAQGRRRVAAIGAEDLLGEVLK